MTVGLYHFQAWARRGIGASVSNVDSGTLPDHARLSVQLGLDVTGGTQPNPVLPPAQSVVLLGPGDIAGVDPRMIIRTEPRQFTVNFEPNYLCGIEFDSPDFPWLFTPAAPNGDRLHPWVALLVLEADEFTTPSVAPNPLPIVVVQSTAALPDLSESWNWAHVQITGDTSLANALATAPGMAISRLLSPRRLNPETSYSAFLVPAFQTGVAAGLGQDTSAMTTSDPAWTPGQNAKVPLTLPYYYRFDFNTSDEGDFESLVRALTPRVLPWSVGQRPLDLDTANPNLPLGGALQSVPPPPPPPAPQPPPPWGGAGKDEFQTALQAVVNQTSASTYDPANPGPDPVIVPPIYGRWASGITSVDRTAAGWENDLNLDPRNRAAAGMGTQVVQEERTQLLASAWQQVAGIRAANQLLAQGQLARAVSQQLFQQHLVAAPPETLIKLTSPLQSRLLASPTTIAATIRASRVPPRMFSGAFRRLSRGRAPTLVTRVNSGALTIVPPPKPPGGLTPVDQVSPTGSSTGLPSWLLIAIIIALVVVLAIGVLAGWQIGLIAAVIAAIAALVAYKQSSSQATNPVTFGGMTPQAIAQVPVRPGFAIEPLGTATPTAGVGAADSAQAAAFRKATTDLFTAIQALPVNPGPAPALDIPTLRKTILARIDPRVTVPARFGSLVNVGTRLGWQPADPLEPMLVAPSFPQPMYAPLRDLDERYLLPGVEGVEANTVGLLDQNQAFIEAYMIGLSHEMSRQLLWNGFPTDQRGTYFRQFWDVSGYIPVPSDPTTLYDIPPIDTWALPTALGTHPNRPNAPGNLVLLVRGELFKRYPNAIVYAGKAKTVNGVRVLDQTDERYPLFRGSLTPDMTFLGFNVTAEDARGGTANAPDGFFFVFQEQPSEPRFGLEPTPDVSPVPHWAELAWTNFAGGVTVTPPVLALNVSPWREASQVFRKVISSAPVPGFLSPAAGPTGIAIVNDANNPDDTNNAWGVNSAQTAYILFRPPFRVLMHADLMLPQP
jgi:hypothetical protein